VLEGLPPQYACKDNTASGVIMGFLSKLFGDPRDRATMTPLYHAIVAEARLPDWYREPQVPDSMDGRFDVVALVMSLVLLRLEREGEAGQLPSVLLTEVFIDDMDGTMREVGFGDLVVGKRVGGIMGMLGGRLGAYRDGDRKSAVIRNVYRDDPPNDAAVNKLVAMAGALEARINAVLLSALLKGSLG
jgi:cytochrome b pre-mRNA-processing protein 3